MGKARLTEPEGGGAGTSAKDRSVNSEIQAFLFQGIESWELEKVR